MTKQHSLFSSGGGGYEYTSYYSGGLSLARRLDYRSLGDWENWTSRDFIVGDEDAGYGMNCKPKPLCGTMERNAISRAMSEKKHEIVERPEDTPDAPWGKPGLYNMVIRITETDEAGDPEHYYFVVSYHEPKPWTPSEMWGRSPFADDLGDSLLFSEVCDLCHLVLAHCTCSDSDLVAAGICPLCGENPATCTCPKDEYEIGAALSEDELAALLTDDDEALCVCGHPMIDHDHLGCLYSTCMYTCRTPGGKAAS